MIDDNYPDRALEKTDNAAVPVLSNERCSRQALFGCGFAAMVIVCLQLN